MEISFFVNSALLGVGLAMDAFSVSLVNGLNEPGMSAPRAWAVSGVYAFFQWFMPMTGWLCVRIAVEKFRAFEPLVPWIAFALLTYIGGGMIAGGLRGGGGERTALGRLTLAALFAQGVATSIDALSAGFAIEAYGAARAFAASAVIALVTWAICRAGLALGRAAGTRLSGRASLLGGCVLVGVGVEILVGSFFRR